MQTAQFIKKTPGGLIRKLYVRRFTPDLFNDTNDHNPLIAKSCARCDGKGFYRTGLGPGRHDKTCEVCAGVGAFEEAEPFFLNEDPPKKVTPNDSGAVQCPFCGKSFPITSNQFWTGLRHSCGQKLILEGPNAAKCWRKQSG